MIDGKRSARGATLTVVLAAVAVLAVAGGLIWFFSCPCEQTPGGYLLGEEATDSVTDWSFVNSDVGLCQIEVRRALLPHSINLNCMATPDGRLYLSCARCDGKSWSTAVIAEPAARIRMNGTVYPVTVTRVMDAVTLDAAWRARAAKLDQPTDRPRQDGWWSFHVASRPG